MVLIAMAGLPGAGKSTVARGLAERFSAVLVSVDAMESAIVRAEISQGFATGLAAYFAAEQVARTNLDLGRHVIVDAANYVVYARSIWSGLAREFGVGLLFVETVCTDLAVHAERLASRPAVPGLPRLTFDDVVVRYAETEPWQDEPRWLVNTATSPDHDRIYADVQAALAANRLESA